MAEERFVISYNTGDQYAEEEAHVCNMVPDVWYRVFINSHGELAFESYEPIALKEAVEAGRVELI